MECVEEDEVEVLMLAELPNMAIFSYLLHGHDMEGLVLTIISWQVVYKCDFYHSPKQSKIS